MILKILNMNTQQCKMVSFNKKTLLKNVENQRENVENI